MADINTAPALPFISKPQTETVVLGTEQTGTLEFPVFNDLTVSEAAWMAANGAKKTAFAYTSKIALQIARAEQVKPLDSHAFVSKVLAAAMGARVEWTEEEQTWQVKYLRELEECAFKVLEVSVIEQQLLVTCMIRHRLPGMENWLGADTAKLPSELCEQIYEFALKEKNRGVAETIEEAVSEVGEMLGKLKTEPGTEVQSTPTGEPSTTPAEISTPETPTSPEPASEPSPRRTSSKRSKKAAASDESTTTP